jgi:hypothetical protein
MERRGRNPWQTFGRRRPENGLNQRKTVAPGCHRLPFGSHGKEGVSGSSPEEGSAKAPHVGAFSFRSTCSDSNVRWVWSPGWSLQVENGLLKPSLSLMNELVDLINDDCSAAFGAPAIVVEGSSRAQDGRVRQRDSGLARSFTRPNPALQAFAAKNTAQTIATIAGNNPNALIEHLL